jgi:hypothetical protein
MDARCELLREFGATSYEDIEQYDKLLKTLKEGIEEGKMYEALLSKLEDDNYLEEWLNTL